MSGYRYLTKEVCRNSRKEIEKSTETQLMGYTNNKVTMKRKVRGTTKLSAFGGSDLFARLLIEGVVLLLALFISPHARQYAEEEIIDRGGCAGAWWSQGEKI